MKDKRPRAITMDAARPNLTRIFSRTAILCVVFWLINKMYLGCEDSNFPAIKHYFFKSGPIKLIESTITWELSLTTIP